MNLSLNSNQTVLETTAFVKQHKHEEPSNFQDFSLIPMSSLINWPRYKVTPRDFQKYHGEGLLAIQQNHSVHEALNSVYPDHQFLPWLFPQVPLGYWDVKENRKAYVTWLLNTVGSSRPEKLTNADFIANRGRGLLVKYRGSIARVFESISDDNDPTTLVKVESELGGESGNYRIRSYDYHEQSNKGNNFWVQYISHIVSIFPFNVRTLCFYVLSL